MKEILHRAIIAVVLLAYCLGCSTTPERGAISRLDSLLEEYDYTLFTPFRSKDMPGSVFVMATNHRGRTVEMSVASTENAFEVPASRVYSPGGQDTELLDQLKTNFSGSGGIGIGLASLVLNANLAGSLTRATTIQFSDPKIIYRMELARLADLRDQMTPQLRATLKAYRDQQQLDSVYIITEVLQVGGMSLTLDLTSGISVDAASDKLTEALTAKANIRIDSDSRITLEFQAPILIGYKAITVPSSLLNTAISVGPLEGYEVLSANQLNAIKRR